MTRLGVWWRNRDLAPLWHADRTRTRIATGLAATNKETDPMTQQPETSAVPPWPDSTPTASTLIAYFVGRSAAACNRFYAVTPPDPESDLAKRWTDEILTMAYAFQTATALIALREADPEAADNTAALIWWVSESGEQGEYLIDWCRTEGLHLAAISAEARTVMAEAGFGIRPGVAR